MMEDMLVLSGLGKNFGGLRAVQDVSFSVRPGEIVGIIGPNGAGKTTLFNLISGFLIPSGGAFAFKGRRLNGLRPDQICHLGIARTFQIPHLFNQLTVLQNVMIGAYKRSHETGEAREHALEILDLFALNGKAEEIAENLTYADCKRLEFARTLATRPELILLDESMGGLTPVEAEEMMGTIETLRKRGITFIVIEHVMQVIMRLCQSIHVLHHGEIICTGTPKEVANDKTVIEAYLGEEVVA